MEVKQTILICNDIDISCRKLALYVVRASLMAVDEGEIQHGTYLTNEWKKEGAQVVVFEISCAEEMQYLLLEARASGVVGVIPENAFIVLAFEPLEEDGVRGKILSELTKGLKLL